MIVLSCGRRRRSQTESGQAGGEVLAIGFVLLVSLVFLGMNAWAVIDAKIRLSGASRFAVRTLVEAEPDRILASAGESTIERGPFNVVTDALKISLADKPKLLTGISVAVELADGAQRCSRAFVTVRATVPSFGLPHVGPLRDGFGVVTRQSEIVDPFRSGLSGIGDCG